MQVALELKVVHNAPGITNFDFLLCGLIVWDAFHTFYDFHRAWPITVWGENILR